MAVSKRGKIYNIYKYAFPSNFVVYKEKLRGYNRLIKNVVPRKLLGVSEESVRCFFE